MKASIAHGIRPSALILGKDSRKRWTRIDITFAKAYQRFLNELCSQCGLPKYICHSDDNRIQFKLATDECAATARSEAEQSRLSKMKTPPDNFGKRLYGQPYLIPEAIEAGLQFSDFREPYYIEQAKKMGLIPADGDAPSE